MYKLLIVDDEAIEREALEFIIKNSSLNISEIQVASNGQEAISVATLFNPDIVILDIKMPGLNGIEAAKILRKIDQEVKIIFLTAFDEFQYAQDAIKIGVEDFIVKPVPNEKAIELLSTVIKQLDHIALMKHQKNDMEVKLSQVSKYLESEFVSSVVTGEIDDQQAKDYLAFMTNDFQSGFGVAIKLDFYSDELVSHLNKNMIKKRFIEKLSGSLNQKVKFLLNHVRDTIYIMVFGYPTHHKELYAKMVGDEIDLVRSFLTDQMQAHVTVGIGDEYGTISELWKSFSQAKIACNKLMLMLDDDAAQNTGASAIEKKEKELCDSIFEGNEAEVFRIIDDILDNLIYTCHDINIVKLRLYEFIILINRSLNKDRNLQNTVPEQLFDGLKTAESKGEAKVYIHEYFRKIMTDIHQLKTDKTGLILDKALKYIQQHYAQEITLDDIAGRSGFSIYYFCKMFKKYYNSSFTDYLSTIRIERAKVLLRDPQMNIKEITQMIGYVDPNYFTRVFKKYEGITPTEYRNKMLRQ